MSFKYNIYLRANIAVEWFAPLVGLLHIRRPWIQILFRRPDTLTEVLFAVIQSLQANSGMLL